MATVSDDSSPELCQIPPTLTQKVIQAAGENGYNGSVWASARSTGGFSS